MPDTKRQKEIPDVVLTRPLRYPERTGFTLIEDVELKGEPTIWLVPLPRGGMTEEAWAERVEKAKKLIGRRCAFAGEDHASRLLEQKNIPRQWTHFHLVFAGTEWKSPLGKECYTVAYFSQHDMAWHKSPMDIEAILREPYRRLVVFDWATDTGQ